MGGNLRNQPVPGAALYLLQNPGTCQNVSVPVIQYKQYIAESEQKFMC